MSSPEKIFIGVAWPYANGSLHLGHIAGCYLPADIFARYHRMKNNDVLMVSGSDEHGTPITLTAEKENTTPQKIVDKYNQEHSKNMQQLGISFDLFTRTTTENHTKVVQDVFLTLHKRNHIYQETVDALYCENCDRFLPDRYIEGICPNCGYEESRGDQCDECGKVLDPEELSEPRCKICGGTPVVKKSDHLFFALSKFEGALQTWLEDKEYWKSNVINFTRNWLKEGLQDRTITRDMKWGIPVPIEGFDEKRIYVWFDAVIGYLAASKEWAQRHDDPEAWKRWWKDKKARHYYFLAKDNIPFHSLIWPAILIGYDDNLNLPYDIPANEYLRLEGEQFSKSRGLAIWISEMTKRFDADVLRYYLSINMPERRDTDWKWDDFVAKNNDELVGTYGNFVHRVLTFTAKNFGEVPEIKTQDELDKKALKKVREAVEKVGASVEQCRFKRGLRAAMKLAQFGNVYFARKKPWEMIKSDREKCGSTLHICLQIVKALSIVMAPYLPFSSDEVWQHLGYTDSVHDHSWEEAVEDVDAGTSLSEPRPLFKKLALEKITPQEEQKKEKKTMDTRDLFAQLDLRVGHVLDVKDHPQADKLYLLQVDVGDQGKKVLVAGMKPYYEKDELTGKRIVMVANLRPAKIRGIKSEGMLLAAEDEKGMVSLLDPGDASAGSHVTADGIEKNPKPVVDFEEFKKIRMEIDDQQVATYDTKSLLSEKGKVKADKKVEEGAKIL